jgi:hypothetical protein
MTRLESSSTLLALPLIISLAAPSLALAQQPPTVLDGDRVRVWTSGVPAPVIGKVISRDGSAMIVKIDGGDPRLAIARDQITRIEVGHRRSRFTTIVWGTLLGCTAGMLIGQSRGDDPLPKSQIWFTAEDKRFIGGVLGTLAGAITGAIVGPGAEHWKDATPPSALAKPQLSATLTLRFK